MRLEWRRPPRTRIVLFDGHVSLLPLVEHGTYSVFANRKTELNLWALLLTIARLRLTWRDYCINYLRLARPRLVVTMTDTNATFYTLKKALPDVRFVAVQNGVRGNGSPRRNGDLWTMLRSSRHQPPAVDAVASFGPAHSKMYEDGIGCATVAVGSVRNNHVPVRRTRPRDAGVRIGLISNFGGLPYEGVFPDGTASPVAIYLGDREISARDFFAADARVAASVSEACETAGWELHVAGRRPAKFVHERRFFADACGHRQFTFSTRESKESSYHVLDDCDLVVAVDSTLGYEMVARGNRALFVNVRAKMLGGPEARQFSFGYPGAYDEDGPFWTASTEPGDLRRLMSSLLAMSEAEWRATSDFVRRDLMLFDPDNAALRGVIASFSGEATNSGN